MSHKKKAVILIMAGGTGGHVFPGIAIAEELVKRGYNIHWLGTVKGMEAQLVPKYGFLINYISIEGLKGKGLIPLLKAPLKITMAICQTISIFCKLKPKLVLGMGGFVSGPGSVAAKLLNIPLIIHEQNAVPGLTNKLSAMIAKRILTAFPSVFKQYPKKTNWVGNPVRSSILSNYNSLNKKNNLSEQSNALNLLVLGGSRGSSIINKTVPQALQRLEYPINVWHQTGANDHENTQQSYKDLNAQAKVTDFIDDMSEAYAWADLVICRSGALTVSELAFCGKPSILIPYPWHKDQQQLKNAQYLKKAGAAIIIEQSLLTDHLLFAKIKHFSLNRSALMMMGKSAYKCAMPESTKVISDICEEFASA